MRLGGLHDIVPAELQDAPDYSSSAPLFLSSLYYLSGGASYYNPTQAAQGNVLPAGSLSGDGNGNGSGSGSGNGNVGGNGIMTADLDTCTQIQCGAISQSDAGIALLEACSAAGYVGTKTCSDPSCSPYLAAMQANGVCPPPALSPAPTPSASPAPQSSPTPMPSATTATMPSIVNTAQVVAPMAVVTPLGMAQRMPNIINPTPAVVSAPCSDSFSQWVNANPLLAIAGLGLLAWVVMGKGGR